MHHMQSILDYAARGVLYSDQHTQLYYYNKWLKCDPWRPWYLSTCCEREGYLTSLREYDFVSSRFCECGRHFEIFSRENGYNSDIEMMILGLRW
jgi:hypothetical protein